MRSPNKLRNVMFLVTVAVFLPFFWMAAFSGPDLTVEESYEKRLAELRDRVQYAESLNRERETDVHHLRKQISLLLGSHNHGNKTFNGGDLIIPQEARDILSNMTFGSSDIQPPGMFHYLPHLIGKVDGLKPQLKLSKGRFGVSIVMGIPTIKRDREGYLLQTLESLLSGLNDAEEQEVLIVVFIAEPKDPAYCQTVAISIQERFQKALDSGVLEVISPPADYYPDLDHLKESFGDRLERVKWRTKQNLDFSFLMLYCKGRGTYYLQLEDDVVTKPGYVSTMKNFAHNQKTHDWVLLEFSYLGFIGKLFKSSDLPRIVEFFLMFYQDKPIDWLLDHFLFVKVCNPEKDAFTCYLDKHYYFRKYIPALFEMQSSVERLYPRHLEPYNLGMQHADDIDIGLCQHLVKSVRILHRPSVFQHIGTYSSLNGKIQKLKKHCRRSINELRRRFKPSMFQHIGTHSSLKGKVQKLKDIQSEDSYYLPRKKHRRNRNSHDKLDKDFGKGPLHRAHFNPNAQVSSSMKTYQHYSIHRAYAGETFFWATNPEKGDEILFKFEPAIYIEKFTFKSGNSDHPGDRFFNTSVEVLPVEAPKQGFVIPPDGFIHITDFDHKTGTAEGTIPEELGEIDSMRMHVLIPGQTWVILNEIYIKDKPNSKT